MLNSTEYGYFLKHIGEKRSLYIPDISELPGSAGKEKAFFQSMGVESAVV